MSLLFIALKPSSDRHLPQLPSSVRHQFSSPVGRLEILLQLWIWHLASHQPNNGLKLKNGADNYFATEEGTQATSWRSTSQTCPAHQLLQDLPQLSYKYFRAERTKVP